MPGKVSGEVPGSAAPPLARVIALAAVAWQALRAGQSLERAAAAALRTAAPDAQRSAPPVSEARRAAAVRDTLYACARRRALIDALVAALASRPPEPSLEALVGVALALLVGRAYADHVVVDQAVGAARAHPAWRPAAGFVNAVLRAFLRRRPQLLDDAERSPSVRYNLPAWWLERLQAAYPLQWQDVAVEQATPPPLTLRVNVRRTTVERMLQRFAEAGMSASPLGPAAPAAIWIHQPRPVDAIPGFAEGLVSVQDAAAQWAAPSLGAADGMRVLDACAAPGGKSAHLLELAKIRLDAVEIDAVRASRIGADLQRLGLPAPGRDSSVRVHVADASQPATFWDGQPYDRILLDAPCTGSGVVRRHPDIPWLRRPSDVAELATRQAALLDALWPLLAPTGRLLYVVCSVFPEEARSQSAAFAQRHPDARASGFVAFGPAGGRDRATVQWLPRAQLRWLGAGDGPDVRDGFFFALFEKVG